MKTESTDIITHVCWDMDPKTKARCRRDPHPKGDHYDPHTRPSWDHPGTTWRS
ncbi:hypothetical protein ABZS95_41545 [Streptomyces sp. NPDC005479]|uniref:hypothetical protein n=1 Tax=unclassified Streptomyces TaxID=2593676 RepID=UPI0033ADD808